MGDAPLEAVHMEVSRPADGVILVILTGEMDIVSSEAVSRRLAGPEIGQQAHVVVDLAGLTFIDSSGINTLVHAVREIEGHGGSAVLTAPSPAVRRVFEIVRVSEIVPVEPHRAAALARSAAFVESARPRDDVR